MSRIVIWILAFILSSTAWAAKAPMKEMTMGVPYKFNRNQALVEYHDFVIAAFAEVGYKVILTPVAIQSSYQMIASGLVDSVAYDDLFEKNGRENIITTSFPVAATVGAIFYNKAKPVPSRALQNFRGALSQNNLALIHEAEKQKLRFVQTANPFHCIQTVLEKKADYCIVIREIGISTLDAIPEARGKILMIEEPFSKVPVHVSMKKKFEKDLPKLEKILKERLRGDLSKYPAIRPALNTNP